MNITEFLLARIEQDERAARNLAEHDRRPVLSIATTVNHPERILAECAAKREIADAHSAVYDDNWKDGEAHGYLWCASCGSLDDSPVPFPCYTTQTLAAVYSDHADYLQGWVAQS